jgi:hypothetical protein
MSVSFSQAALDRIAECASSEVYGPETVPARALIEQYLSGEPRHGLSDKDFPDLSDTTLNEIFGDFSDSDLERANALYRFAGLLELAIRVGYVDLSGWNEAGVLHDALGKFAEREGMSENPTDLTLVHCLITRLEKQEWGIATRDDDAFFAFASLLHLTVRIREDREALHFLHQSSGAWSAAADLPFLLTPRHFAEAITFNTISGVESKTVAGGLAALRYLQSFAEILKCIAHLKPLVEAFVRQARWSHHAPGVQRRVSVWVHRMSEWAASGVDHEGEEMWRQFKKSVLVPIKLHLIHIRPQMIQDLSVVHTSSAGMSIAGIDELLVEGRIGAARKLARQYAERSSHRFAAATGADVSEASDELIAACNKLAELGEFDLAAVIVAPFLDKLDSWNLEKARKLLAGSRTANQPVVSPASEKHPVTEDFLLPSDELKHYSLGSEEGTSFTTA